MSVVVVPAPEVPGVGTSIDDGTGIRVLGPLEVCANGRSVDVGGPRLRALVALLTAEVGRVVSVGTLVNALWSMDAPPDARRTARTYVSRIRSRLASAFDGDELITTHAAGYRLRLSADFVDATRFERLAALGRGELAAGRPASAIDRLSAGLALWRGDAYGEFAHVSALRAEAVRLRQIWLTATEDHIDAQLATGAGDTLVGQLMELTDQYPGHDRLWEQLMIALYRAGRQPEALEAFLRARTALVELAGVDLSARLVEVHRRILDHDPALQGPRSSGPRIQHFRPAQLPADVAGFTGRNRELDVLDAAAAEQPTTVVVYGMSGTAGVGKTALAVHWAHRARPVFPDGQLYVNLRGFDPEGVVLDPAAAMRGFLDAFGVPPANIPSSLEAQSALYRTLLADRRVLVVLDNARDAEHARPLLPGAPGSLALVTSRNQLTSLAVTEGAHLLTLDVLNAVETQALLTNRLGVRRVLAEPAAVAEIVARCAGLPLALAIVAARAAAQPHLPLSGFAEELRESCRRLDFLDGGDPATQIRAVFSWSYRALSPAAAGLFRQLAVHPGPDIAEPATAGLAGLPLHRIRPLLAELVRGCLLTQHAPGRYIFHDLLRDFATELALTDDGEEARLAYRRMFDHYLYTARAADTVLTPQHRPMALPAAEPHSAPESLPSHDAAAAWFSAERAILVRLVQHASDTQAWQLAASLTTFLDRNGYWRQLAEVQTTALAGAERQGDPAGQASAHRSLGLAEDRLGRLDSAREHYARALDLFAALGDDAGVARTRQHLARMSSAEGDYQRARHHAQHSLAHYQAINDQAGRSAALNQLGWCSAQLGHYEEARENCAQALPLAQEIGDINGQAHIWDSLGYIHHHLNQHAQAIDCYRHALDMFRLSGVRRSEATTLASLGETQYTAGDRETAGHTWRQALDIIAELDLPDTDPLPVKILANLHATAD
jgi:DNA-binding SARP family transcriptional activator/Tfp pilus assembly protein PilF